jgi:hypothetical protein
MAKQQRYEAQVDIRATDGQLVTYSGDGVGPAGESGQQLLAGAEAAALAQQPGGTVEASRVRKA